jgi:hypothetical protein
MLLAHSKVHHHACFCVSSPCVSSIALSAASSVPDQTTCYHTCCCCCTGRSGRGPHAGAWNTVWGLQTDRGRALPLPCPQNPIDARNLGCGAYGPLLNLVGANVQGRAPSDWWVENIPATRLVPQDLYTAQVKARLGRVLYTAPMPTMPRGSRRAGIREVAIAAPVPVRLPPTISRRSTPAPSRVVVRPRADRRGSAVASLIDIMLEEFGASRGFSGTVTPYELLN